MSMASLGRLKNDIYTETFKFKTSKRLPSLEAKKEKLELQFGNNMRKE